MFVSNAHDTALETLLHQVWWIYSIDELLNFSVPPTSDFVLEQILYLLEPKGDDEKAKKKEKLLKMDSPLLPEVRPG